jgi:hypothetical protein
MYMHSCKYYDNPSREKDPIEGRDQKGGLSCVGKIKKEAKMWRIGGGCVSPEG